MFAGPVVGAEHIGAGPEQALAEVGAEKSGARSGLQGRLLPWPGRPRYRPAKPFRRFACGCCTAPKPQAVS